MRTTRQSGFSLIELITVMAITAILMTIIFLPVVQGFNLTRAAQGFADAQEKARSVVRLLERNVGNASGVRDNSGAKGSLWVVVPGRAAGTWEPVLLPNVKLDLAKVSEGEPNRGPSGAFINPDTGKEDPTLKAPKGQANLPSVQGPTIERWFVGLRAPLVDRNGDGDADQPGLYFNPYDGLLQARSGGRDNLYVLFRAEVTPKIWNAGAGRYQVDTRYFQDANGDNEPDDLDDPAFFTLMPGVDATYPTGGLTAAGQAKAARIQNWLRASTVVTEVSRYDMIAAAFNKTNRAVYFDGNVPRIVPMVRFQPTRVTSEPAVGESALRTGSEVENGVKAGPDTYVTQYGSWSSLLMRVWPSTYPSSWGAANLSAGTARPRWGLGGAFQLPYLVGRPWVDNLGVEHFSLFGFDPQTMTDDLAQGVEVFDVKRFLEVSALPRDVVPRPYAFTEAANLADSRSGWLGQAMWRTNFVPVAPGARSGKVKASFESREVGTDQNVPYDYRVPTYGQQSVPGGSPIDLSTGVRVSPYDPNTSLDYTPSNDPGVGSGNFYDVLFQPVNRRFNKLWTDFPVLAPSLDRAQYVKRYVDLRIMPQPDGTRSPLDPANGVARAFVTPGSETVIGPDQKPGPNYGRYVRYARATKRPVGPNQYFINYVDQPEPDWSALNLSGNGAPNLYDPMVYDGTNFVQAVLQPQYRAGYLELNSKFGEPIPSGYLNGGSYVPTGNIFVSYRFQYTEPNDVVAADYDSAQVLEINLTIKNHPQSSLPNAQTITVRGTTEVRNFLR